MRHLGFWIVLGVPSPFFPGILLSRKPPESQGKRRSVFEKNEGWKRMEKESTPRLLICFSPGLRGNQPPNYAICFFDSDPLGPNQKVHRSSVRIGANQSARCSWSRCGRCSAKSRLPRRLDLGRKAQSGGRGFPARCFFLFLFFSFFPGGRLRKVVLCLFSTIVLFKNQIRFPGCPEVF